MLSGDADADMAEIASTWVAARRQAAAQAGTDTVQDHEHAQAVARVPAGLQQRIVDALEAEDGESFISDGWSARRAER